MNWEELLSLKKYGDRQPRLRKEQNETRLGFEVDYDRITFSSAFRSLQDKTQVIPLSKTGFVHTRLTHSLEVSVVGRSLGRSVGRTVLQRYPELARKGFRFNDFGAVVAAAALAHDIGNPPFGHSGEKAIGQYFKTGNGRRFTSKLTEKEYGDLVRFEGNANGFRRLTQTHEGAKDGLRLTYATLGAFTKYPKESLPHRPTRQIADKKFGVFQSEKLIFEDIAKSLGLLKTNPKEPGLRYKRHPLAFLVEAADDICYTLIDFEDGINLGLIEEDYALEYLIKLVKDRIIKDNYYALTTKKARVSYLRALAISTLIGEAITIFLDNEKAILNGNFHTSLLDCSRYKAQIEDILTISIEKVYHSSRVMEKEIAGYKIIETLLDTFTKTAESEKENSAGPYENLVKHNFLSTYDFKKGSTYQHLINICSDVAGLTDGSALRIYKKLTGTGT